MTKVYVFGNEYLEEDNLALKVSDNLHNVEIIRCTSPDDLLAYASISEEVQDDIVILDVVKNISEPMILDDVSKFKINKMMSLHDFDVAYFLNLMKELDMGKNIKIIGIPITGDAKELSKKVMLWL